MRLSRADYMANLAFIEPTIIIPSSNSSSSCGHAILPCLPPHFHWKLYYITHSLQYAQNNNNNTINFGRYSRYLLVLIYSLTRTRWTATVTGWFGWLVGWRAEGKLCRIYIPLWNIYDWVYFLACLTVQAQLLLLLLLPPKKLAVYCVSVTKYSDDKWLN